MVGNETSEIYDIYGIWHVPFWQTTPFIVCMWVLAGIVALALLYLVARLIMKRKKIIKPWTWADRELDALWKNRGFTREDGKRFYSQLTEIIKIYLEKRYGYQVRSATDIELIAYLRARNFDAVLCNDLTRIFEGAQEIKFANLDAIPENIERDFALAKAFVAKTISDKDVA
jgi:hypothetical protein